MSINGSIRARMSEATRVLMSSGPSAATAVIQKALKGMARPGIEVQMDNPNVAAQSPNVDFTSSKGLETVETTPAFVSKLFARLGVPSSLQPTKVAPETKHDGQFLTKSFTNHAGTRHYKLYIPSSYRGQAMPLMVMLHGCTQSPDDFAAGTRMNTVAEEKQCFVIYPTQTQSANSSKCWNWFQAVDQQRGQGEPSIIAGITHEVLNDYKLDPNKVYVAGLSAGGAMAVIMGTTYPELYAAVGVHSGLPYASADDLPSAFNAMKSGMPKAYIKHKPTSGSHLKSIPIIVFHGDRDTTVNHRNADQLMEQNVPSSIFSHRDSTNAKKLNIIVEEGKVAGGHRYTRTSHHDNDDNTIAEHWVIHGAGHAWAGGSQAGSYTDAKGPDATREMMRFFSTQSQNTILE